MEARSASDVRAGDVVVYPAVLRRRERRSPSDALRVSRVVGRDVKGFRVHPDEWEREFEFTVFARQIEANGLLVERAEPDG